MNKKSRQAAILEAVAQEELATQNELVKALRKRGVKATQVSVSRDVAELGLVKIGGVYKPASGSLGAPDPEMPLRTFVRRAEPAGPNMIVIRCDAGTAQRVGLVVDGLSWEGVVGTIAGDDTVFIAVSDAASNRRVCDSLKTRMRRS